MLGGVLLSVSLLCAAPSGSVETPANLPDIVAKILEVRIVRRSRSNRTYMIDLVGPESPQTGRIVLLKRDAENIMAFRVLKTYPDRRFAAKWVRRYPGYENLEPGDTYQGIEKVSDVVPPPQTAGDRAEVRELEAAGDSAFGAETPPLEAPPLEGQPGEALPGEATPAPETLPDSGEAAAAEAASDAGADAVPEALPAVEPGTEGAPVETAPAVGAEDADGAEAPLELGDPEQGPPTASVDGEGVTDVGTEQAALPAEKPRPVVEAQPIDIDPDDLEDESTQIWVEENPPIDPFNNALSAVFGFFTNNAATEGFAVFAGAGVRYTLTPIRSVFIDSPRVQDSISFEGGAHLYRVLNYLNPGDAYTVVPLTAVGRYNILLGETYGVYGYAGFGKDFAFASTLPDDDALALLGQFRLHIGGGMLFRIGPQWEGRIDVGTDIIGGGLVLRF